MSLGWNTESALLPSKAKKIEVDNRSVSEGSSRLRGHRGCIPGSDLVVHVPTPPFRRIGLPQMLDLKALVAEKEEAARAKLQSSGASSSLRQGRGEGEQFSSGGGGLDDVFSRANAGVEERQAADAMARDAERARRRGSERESVLAKKVIGRPQRGAPGACGAEGGAA